MRNPFYRESPLVEATSGRPLNPTPLHKKIAEKTVSTVEKHPLATVAIALATTHAASYGMLMHKFDYV